MNFMVRIKIWNVHYMNLQAAHKYWRYFIKNKVRFVSLVRSVQQESFAELNVNQM